MTSPDETRRWHAYAHKGSAPGECVCPPEHLTEKPESPTLRTIDAIKAMALREAADHFDALYDYSPHSPEGSLVDDLRERADSLDPPVT